MINNSGAGTSVPSNSIKKNGTKVPTPKGYKQTKVGVIPEDWDVVKLGDVGDFIGGGTPSTNNVQYWQGDIPWISSSDLTDKSIYKINKHRFINEIAINESATKKVPKNAILIVSRVGVGKVAISDVALCTSQDFQCLVPKDAEAIFLAYLIKEKTKLLIAFNQGTSIKGFVKSDLKNLKISLPPLKEQQKIGQILIAWDDAISKQEALIEAKEELKKGLMQKLLSGEVRFDEFGVGTSVPSNGKKAGVGTSVPSSSIEKNGTEVPTPSGWDDVRLRDIASRITTKNTDNLIDMVFSNSALNGIVIQNEFFDKDIANRDNLTGYYIVESDDFVYNPRISKHAPSGPINRNRHDFSGIVSPLYTVFRTNDNEIIDYLEYFFSSTLWFRYMKAIANYGARHDRMNITNNDFMKMPIPYPFKEEQQKIAQVLTLTDKEIDLLKNELEALKEQKNGLMQRLLSGEVRVVV